MEPQEVGETPMILIGRVEEDATATGQTAAVEAKDPLAAVPQVEIDLPSRQIRKPTTRTTYLVDPRAIRAQLVVEETLRPLLVRLVRLIRTTTTTRTLGPDDHAIERIVDKGDEASSRGDSRLKN